MRIKDKLSWNSLLLLSQILSEFMPAPQESLSMRWKKLGSKITIVSKDGKSADALRLMAAMGLGIKCGDTVTVTVDGDNEINDAAQLETFFKENL